MESRLRVAVVGVSHWHAPRYLQSLAANATTLVAVSDHDADHAKLRAGELGCEGFGDTSAMLTATRPDFVVVLPRHDRALADITAVGDARVAALIEKPMGADAQQTAAAAAAMNRAGVFAASCLPNRHLEFWKVISALDADGTLGTPVHATFRVINGPPQRYVDSGVPWMLDARAAGGGVLRNLGAHGADAALSLAAGAPLCVRGATIGRRAHGLAGEDYAVATLATAAGFVATMDVGYSYAAMTGGEQHWSLAATGAYIVDANGTLTVTMRDGRSTSTPCGRAAEAYRTLVDETLRRFRAGQPPVADVDACVRAMTLVDDIYRHAGPPLGATL